MPDTLRCLIRTLTLGYVAPLLAASAWAQT